MADHYIFDNEDSDDERADAEEKNTLAARDTWVGVANSTQDQFKVETFLERVREKSPGGEMENIFSIPTKTSLGGNPGGASAGLSVCFGLQVLVSTAQSAVL